METEEMKRLFAELENIKGLLALIANKTGASQTEIARVLGVSDRAVRRTLGQK